MRQVIAVDIGGTKVAVALVDEAGNISHRLARPSLVENAQMMFQGVVLAIEELLQQADLSPRDLYGMGIGVPGKVDREQGVAIFQNNLPWPNYPLVANLKDYFGMERVTLDNDVYQAAFAEWKLAKLKSNEIMAYYTISTGIACAFIQNGEFIRGAGFAGEAGLIPLSSTGQIARLEKAASGVALEKKAQRVYEAPLLTTAEVYRRYYGADPLAVELVEQQAQQLAYSLYMIICLLDPHQLVLGGSVITHNPILLQEILSHLEDLLIPAQEKSLRRVRVSDFETEPGLIGAGLSVFQAFDGL